MFGHIKLILSTSGAQIYGLVAGMVVLWLTLNILGPAERGVFIIAVTWVRMACGIAHLSLGQTILHHAAQVKNSTWLPHTLGSALAVCAGMTGIIWLCLGGISLVAHTAIFGPDIPRPVLWLSLLAVPFLLWDFYNAAILTAIDRLPVVNRGRILSQTLNLLLMPAICVIGVYGAVLAFIIGQVSNAAYGIRTLLSSLPGGITFSSAHTRTLLKNALQLHPAVLCGVLVSSVDTLMVGRFIGATEGGYYQMAFQFLNAMLILPQTAAMVLFTLTSKGGPVASWPECRKIILVICAAMIAGSVCAWALAPYLIPGVFGANSAPVVPIFRWLQLTVLGQALAALAGPQWIANGYFKTVSAISIFFTLGNLALNWILIPRYGVYGGVAATAFIYFFSVIINGGLLLAMEYRWRRAAPLHHA